MWKAAGYACLSFEVLQLLLFLGFSALYSHLLTTYCLPLTQSPLLRDTASPALLPFSPSPRRRFSDSFSISPSPCPRFSGSFAISPSPRRRFSDSFSIVLS